MHILYIHPRPVPDSTAPAWSGAQVARAIRRTSRHTAHTLSAEDFLANSDGAVELCTEADVLVLSGDLLPEAHTAIQRWKARDKTLIADLDGFSLELSPNGKCKAHRRAAFPTTEELFRWGLRLTHGATSCSLSMVEGWRCVTTTHYLPATIDLEAYACLVAQPHSGIVIGLAGGASWRLDPETQAVLEVLERLCRRREDIRLLLTCPGGAAGREHGFLNLPQLLRERLGGTFSGTTRAQRLAQVDIGLVLGINRPSNALRDILELMAVRIPWMSIESPDLYDWRRFGWLVEPNPRMLEWILNDMVDKLPAYQKEAGGEPYLFALSRGIDENIEQIVSVYASIQSQAALGEVRHHDAQRLG